MTLAGSRFLVTGATSGIGLAAASRLLADGATVLLTGRTHDTVGKAVDELGETDRTHGVVADLHTPEGVAAATAAAQDRFAALDGLVLSHGGAQVPQPFAEVEGEDFPALAEAVFLTNARLVHAMLPLLRGASGRIVLVTSEAARYPTPGEVMIGALAAANIMFIRTLAREVARDGIRANAVAVTLTRDTHTYSRVMTASSFSRSLFEKAEKRMPFAPVRADDVAASVAHLLSTDTAKVTGQVIGVTGGLTT